MMDLVRIASERAMELNGLARDVEAYDETVQKIEGKDILSLTDRKESFHLDTVLSPEQMSQLRHLATEFLEANVLAKKRKIMEYCGLVDDDVQPMQLIQPEQPVEPEQPKPRRGRPPKKETKAEPNKDQEKKFEFNYDIVKKMYIDNKMTVSDIASKFNAEKKEVHDYLDKMGLIAARKNLRP